MIYIFLFMGSVLISSISQILLKRSALKTYSTSIKEYLNPAVILAYTLFFASTLLTIWAYKSVPLSAGPILEASGYVYVVILSRLFLNEQITKRKYVGNLLIVTGIILCYTI